METVRPTTNEAGFEQHPAWCLIGASRVQSGPPGATLFDSDIRHHHYIIVRLSRARRKRDLNRDWIGTMGRGQIIEVAMSEAQWASFVSTMNTGDGVPCTILSEDYERTPGMPHEPRLSESMDEVRDAGAKALRHIREKFAAVEEKPTKANIRSLKAAIENAPANMGFAAESLSEHAENVVTKARADIEAMVISKSEQIGLKPGDLGEVPQLGQESEDSNE